MVRPKRMRRVVTCHRHELNKNLKPIELSVDEFEAIRFKDYHNIKRQNLQSSWEFHNQHSTEF